ncbi:MAG: UDP-N-acetylglucosamine 1-carboxyvinyltransferase [Elusimicrobia bacterium]|nr:UDP-N-acetylglucosamine 1-carboxyvinyltransferase [Elusimicrobiota bacterium]
MDKIIIKGGRQLSGTVQVSGSKNAALPILIATLLTDGECVVRNVPELKDIETVIALLGVLGKQVVRQGDTVQVSASSSLYAEAPYEIVRRMRASILVMGPLVARLKRARVSLPGGCVIGRRPVDIHLKGFSTLGADITLREGYIEVQANHLRGRDLRLTFPSVGATENLMMVATLTSGTTRLFNAAREPEIEDLARFLNGMGAHVQGAGTSRITIVGVPSLHGAHHRVIPDRIEAGTYLLAAAITQGRITLQGVEPPHLTALLQTLRKAGVQVLIDASSNTITTDGKGRLRPVTIKTAPYPSFPTDLQAQWMALMAVTAGVSRITEQIFEDRFLHVSELVRMGADIHTEGNTAIIRGVKVLCGAPVMVSDLRAGAALILAGLVAKGTTVVHRVYHLDRGYAALVPQLCALGASIDRISS